MTHSRCLAALAFSLLTTSPLAAQTDSLATPQFSHVVAFGASDSLPAGQMIGVVISDSTGLEVKDAQVWLTPAASRQAARQQAAFTDSAGRFQFATPPGGSAMLHAQRIGFAPIDVPLHLEANKGYGVVIALREVKGFSCDNIIGPHPGIVVRVRSVLTGAWPAGGATVIVTDGPFRDSLTQVAAPPDSAAWLKLAWDRPAKYAVTVRSPGHQEWHGTAKMHALDCGGYLPSGVRVWLIPK